jgi:signal transduction histidine kinase
MDKVEEGYDLIQRKIVSEVIDLLSEKISSKKIKITDTIPEDLIVTADKNMMKPIFRNLISNTLEIYCGNRISRNRFTSIRKQE